MANDQVIDCQKMPENYCISRKSFTKKNGDVIVREYNQSKFNSTWYEKNKTKMTTSEDCVCGGRFSPNNRFKHYNTKTHRRYMEYNEIKMIVSDI